MGVFEAKLFDTSAHKATKCKILKSYLNAVVAD